MVMGGVDVGLRHCQEMHAEVRWQNRACVYFLSSPGMWHLELHDLKRGSSLPQGIIELQAWVLMDVSVLTLATEARHGSKPHHDGREAPQPTTTT